ncbi:hypothetical protein BaRGS_00025381 [Batillaria attramentaria]|uniref:Uncharacterized protein n=1 Tax=Batillaria attramentaria TaxID=370345 RepID=A0ABD0K904_9CAEN
MTLLCGRRHTRYLKNPSFHPYRHSARHVQTFCKAANCSHTRKFGLTKRHHYQQPSQTTKLRTGQKGFLLNNTNRLAHILHTEIIFHGNSTAWRGNVEEENVKDRRGIYWWETLSAQHVRTATRIEKAAGYCMKKPAARECHLQKPPCLLHLLKCILQNRKNRTIGLPGGMVLILTFVLHASCSGGIP